MELLLVSFLSIFHHVPTKKVPLFMFIESNESSYLQPQYGAPWCSEGSIKSKPDHGKLQWLQCKQSLFTSEVAFLDQPCYFLFKIRQRLKDYCQSQFFFQMQPVTLYYHIYQRKCTKISRSQIALTFSTHHFLVLSLSSVLKQRWKLQNAETML